MKRPIREDFAAYNAAVAENFRLCYIKLMNLKDLLRRLWARLSVMELILLAVAAVVFILAFTTPYITICMVVLTLIILFLALYSEV